MLTIHLHCYLTGDFIASRTIPDTYRLRDLHDFCFGPLECYAVIVGYDPAQSDD